MKKAILATALAIAFVISCQKQHDNLETHDHAAAQTEHDSSGSRATEKSDDHADNSVALELDSGKKWRINAEMTPFINEQKSLLDAFDSDTGDAKKLAADLQAANEQLIKSCTMKGKSHDVLHVWLTNHMNLISRLGKSTMAEETEKIADELEDSFKSFHRYFE